MERNKLQWTFAGRTNTEQLNRYKQVQSSKAKVTKNLKPAWISDDKIENMSYKEFILVIVKVNNMEHKLFGHFLSLEASLDCDTDWDILKELIKNTISDI